MAVDALGVPAELGEAGVDRLDGHDVIGVAVDAHLVAVDDGDEVAQLEVPGRHRRLPHLSLGQLSVAEHAPGAVVTPAHSPPEGDADGDREAVPERAGAEVDARDLAHVGVVTESATEPRVVVELGGSKYPRSARTG